MSAFLLNAASSYIIPFVTLIQRENTVADRVIIMSDDEPSNDALLKKAPAVKKKKKKKGKVGIYLTQPSF